MMMQAFGQAFGFEDVVVGVAGQDDCFFETGRCRGVGSRGVGRFASLGGRV